LANAGCGYLVVPEDRSQPSGRTIQLFVAIIPAQSGKSAPDPIVYLGSGPGGIAIVEATDLINSEVNRNRDLVVMNQRDRERSRSREHAENSLHFNLHCSARALPPAAGSAPAHLSSSERKPPPEGYHIS
jgi:hypothetical protein